MTLQEVAMSARNKRASRQCPLISMRVAGLRLICARYGLASARLQPAHRRYMGCCLAAAPDARVVPGFVMRTGMSVRAEALMATAAMAGGR
jgi:hypothetical protein